MQPFEKYGMAQEERRGEEDSHWYK